MIRGQNNTLYTTSSTATESPSCSVVESEVQKPSTPKDGYPDESKYCTNLNIIKFETYTLFVIYRFI